MRVSQHFFTGISGLPLVLLYGGLSLVHAQQTVFNVPTTDVLDKGKVYFELDISLKPNDTDALSHFSSFVPRLVVGAGGRVEMGLNITGNIQPGADTTTLVPAFKFKAYDGKDNGWAIAVGDHLFIPVHNKSYDFGNHTYVMVQKTFKTKTRIALFSRQCKSIKGQPFLLFRAGLQLQLKARCLV